MNSSSANSQTAVATQVTVTDDTLSVELSDGRTIAVPLAWYPRLVYATTKERTSWRLIAGGRGIHWADLDEDTSGPRHKLCNKFGPTGMLEIVLCSGVGGSPMRGRKPRALTVAGADTPVLEAVAHSRRLAWFQVQHARIVLAVAAGESIQAVASRMECDRATVWRVCRRYEQGGLHDLLLDDPRVGRPPEISPPPARPNGRTGLPGTDRRRTAHHPLDQRG